MAEDLNLRSDRRSRILHLGQRNRNNSPFSKIELKAVQIRQNGRKEKLFKIRLQNRKPKYPAGQEKEGCVTADDNKS